MEVRAKASMQRMLWPGTHPRPAADHAGIEERGVRDEVNRLDHRRGSQKSRIFSSRGEGGRFWTGFGSESGVFSLFLFFLMAEATSDFRDNSFEDENIELELTEMCPPTPKLLFFPRPDDGKARKLSPPGIIRFLDPPESRGRGGGAGGR